MRDQDRRTEMDRKGSKAVERKLRQSEKRTQRLQRIKPKQLKTVIDDLNMKTLAELTAPHYVSAASSDHRGIAALHETEEEEEKTGTKTSRPRAERTAVQVEMWMTMTMRCCCGNIER